MTDENKTKLTYRKGAPLFVEGDVQLVDGDGNAIVAPGTKMAICRCGHSQNQPFCDGAHARMGFTE